MILDQREKHELVQALLRARNRTYGGNVLDNVAQADTASGDGSYGEPAFGGIRFLFAPQPGMTVGEQAARQSREPIPSPRPNPFRDPARFSYASEGADRARARGNPAHNQPAFTEARGTPSRPADPQTIYDRPVAVKTASVVPLRYWEYLWGESPTYCPPTGDTLTFPPLIYQDKAPLTEADKDDCHRQFEHDRKQCYKNYSYDSRALGSCYDRADIIRDLCLRGEKETKPWNDVDEDGVRFPRPRKRWKKK